MTDLQQPEAPAHEPAASAVKPAKQRNILAIVAISAAILGFIFAVIPGAFIIGWVLLPIAFVLSIVALVQKDKRKGLAVAALIISIVGTIAGVVAFTASVAAAFNDSFGGTETTVTAPEAAADEEAGAAEEPAAAEAGSRENPVAIGSTISGDEYTVVINSFTPNATDQVLGANQFNEAPADGLVYAVVNATITYTGAESGFAAMVGIDYVADSGEVLSGTDNFAVAPDPALGLDELYNGGTATGNIVVAIPADNSGTLRVRPGMLADEVFVATK